jgi:hypothetical protein
MPSNRRALRTLLHELADALADALEPATTGEPAAGERPARARRRARPRVSPASETDRAFARRELKDMGLMPGSEKP